VERLQTASRDTELWHAFKQGDQSAFACLFKRYYSVLIQYGTSFGVEPAMLEDCIQDLFIELWQRKSPAEIQSVKAYLLTSLKYKILRARRSQNKVAEFDQDGPFELSHENFIIQSEEEQQHALKILKAINRLPNRQKEIVYLKLYQQLNYEELSEVMQINYQAARNLFYQALKSLRSFLS
jgi:RNA polymerase sigma-70 factor (ECF subfamily)